MKEKKIKKAFLLSEYIMDGFAKASKVLSSPYSTKEQEVSSIFQTVYTIQGLFSIKREEEYSLTMFRPLADYQQEKLNFDSFQKTVLTEALVNPTMYNVIVSKKQLCMLLRFNFQNIELEIEEKEEKKFRRLSGSKKISWKKYPEYRLLSTKVNLVTDEYIAKETTFSFYSFGIIKQKITNTN